MHSRTKLLEFIELAKAKGYPLNNAIKIKDLFLSFGEHLKIRLMNGLWGPTSNTQLIPLWGTCKFWLLGQWSKMQFMCLSWLKHYGESIFATCQQYCMMALGEICIL